MEALKAIGWFILMIVVIVLIFEFIGYRGLTNLVPEGYRRWHIFAQLCSLACFAALVHFNPF